MLLYVAASARHLARGAGLRLATPSTLLTWPPSAVSTSAPTPGAGGHQQPQHPRPPTPSAAHHRLWNSHRHSVSAASYRACSGTAAPPAGPQLPCWSCQEPCARTDAACKACSKLQPPQDDLDHFQLLGLPEPRFDVDPVTLDQHYKRLQWQIHPDKFSGSSSVEAEYAAEHAMRVNAAYGVLRSPLGRAKYLLHLWGQDGDLVSGEATMEDPELLMEVMEAREEVDACEDQGALKGLLERNRGAQVRVTERLAAALEAYRGRLVPDGAAPGLPHGAAARRCAVELTYLVKLEEEVVKKLTHL